MPPPFILMLMLYVGAGGGWHGGPRSRTSRVPSPQRPFLCLAHKCIPSRSSCPTEKHKKTPAYTQRMISCHKVAVGFQGTLDVLELRRSGRCSLGSGTIRTLRLQARVCVLDPKFLSPRPYCIIFHLRFSSRRDQMTVTTIPLFTNVKS